MVQNYKKITQLLDYFARKNKSHQISKLKAIKLIWAADRYHLRKYGRLVSGDDYYAMKLGPVGTDTKDIAQSEKMLGDTILGYSVNYIKSSEDKNTVHSVAAPDEELFSKTDLEALEFAWNHFGGQWKFDIAALTHEYPEWKKFEDAIQVKKKTREHMDLMDFFEDPNPTKVPDDPFKLSRETLEDSKEIFSEIYK